MNAEIEAIRSCEYLYLHSISECEDDGLRLVLHEATVGGAPDAESLAHEQLPELRELLSKSKAILHSAGCRVFELVWANYVGYSVENESYAAREPDDSLGEGRLVIIYTKSVYLDYLARATFASSDYPGPFQHWAICCLDHIVNVASTVQPVVRITHGA